MAGYNPYRGAGITPQGDLRQELGPVTKLFRRLSTLGAKYDEMVIRNSKGVNINEDPRVMDSPAGGGMYDMFSRKATAMIAAAQPQAFYTYSYPEKRNILRTYAIKDEIRDFITRIADAAIVYNRGKRFCEIADLPTKYKAEVKQRLSDVFSSIYNAPGYKFNDGQSAWRVFRQFIIDGFKAWEIVYDDRKRNIVGFNELDPAFIVQALDPESGLLVWVQNPNDPQNRRILLSSDIVYLSYSGANEISETSYVDPLIRPYNQLQLLQQAKIMYNLMHATMHKVFTMPVDGMSRDQAEMEMGMAIADYKDEVVFDDFMGTVRIDGQPHIPYSKEYWFPQDSKGKPEMDIVSPEGHNLNESDMLKWFYNILKRASKIPLTRFDQDGGGIVFGDSADITNDDLNFENFISRLRAIFREIIIKPVYNQMVLEFPELLDDPDFEDSLNLKYYSNTQSEQARFLKNMETRANIASTLTNNLRNSEDKPALHIKWVLKNIMEFTDAQIAENEKYFLEDPMGGAEGQGGGGGVSGGGAPDGGGAPGAEGLDLGLGDEGGGEDTPPEEGGGPEDTPQTPPQVPPQQ